MSEKIIEVEFVKWKEVSCPFLNHIYCCVIRKLKYCGIYTIPDDCPLLEGDVVVRFKEK